MKVKIQHCWCGGDTFKFRALICGGLLVRADVWNRKVASAMLDLIEVETGWNRKNIRFEHV